MNVPEKATFLELLTSYWPGALFAGMMSVVGYLVRTVFTNQKKLIKLETEITEREKAAQRGRDDLTELKTDFKEMNKNLMDYFSRREG